MPRGVSFKTFGPNFLNGFPPPVILGVWGFPTWNNPESQLFGQGFLTLPAFDDALFLGAHIPAERYINEGATNSFDPSKGAHAKDLAMGSILSKFRNTGR